MSLLLPYYVMCAICLDACLYVNMLHFLPARFVTYSTLLHISVQTIALT